MQLNARQKTRFSYSPYGSMILVEWIGWLCLKNTCSPMSCVCMLDMTFVLRCRSSIGRIDGLKSQAILLPAANGQLNHLRFCVITLQKLQNQYANQAKAINTPYINSRYHSIHNSVNTFFLAVKPIKNPNFSSIVLTRIQTVRSEPHISIVFAFTCGDFDHYS